MKTKTELDEIELITALLHDTQKSHEAVFSTRALQLTTNVVASRVRSEGKSFLTVTLPRLGKALDRVLASDTLQLKASELGFEAYPDAEFPKLFGELFAKVLDKDGKVLHEPCVQCVRSLRQIMYLWYKYELPYTHEQELQVLNKFKQTETDLMDTTADLRNLRNQWLPTPTSRKHPNGRLRTKLELAREARYLLHGVFANFDYRDIIPRHGPGAVATKQRLWEKYQWSNICGRITEYYPLDEYFLSSKGAVCDKYRDLCKITDYDLPAKVILVPKDSRGPRLISCEPVDFQWVQQGLGRAIVAHVERISLTKGNVFFTDQRPNQRGALAGSRTGNFSTLDLNEASDRVSVELVKLLYPEHMVNVLLACRSRSTVLPSGEELELQKFAPMGSGLCFPILALTVWAILTAGAPDADTRECIFVYGDDVIVPTAQAACAIEQLEAFGLRVNRDKSCTSGFFRESCGVDAYRGVPVTPVRLRTVWSSLPTVGSYTSWIQYANSFYDRKCFCAYDYIVSRLEGLYGPIPSDDMSQRTYPSLREATALTRKIKKRTHAGLQKVQHKVRVSYTRPIRRAINGWDMLLRSFTERGRVLSVDGTASRVLDNPSGCLRVDQYTPRDASMLVFRWR